LPGNIENLKDWDLFSCELLSNYQAAITVSPLLANRNILNNCQLAVKEFTFD
jgi:hypothetical protein